MAFTVHRNAIKERIRGPDLSVLVKIADGVPMEEALLRADEARVVIASSKRMGKALVGSEEWRSIADVFPCWSGTMTAYERPDKKLGETIECIDPDTGIRYVFPVPEEHIGKKNVILVAEHPDLTIETEGTTMIISAKEVGAVPDFPVAADKWYKADSKYDLPTGSEVDGSDQASVYLWRTEKRVGLVVRGDYFSNYGWRYIGLEDLPSCRFGVATEAIHEQNR